MFLRVQRGLICHAVASTGFVRWSATSVDDRAQLLEAMAGDGVSLPELMMLLCREAGKVVTDAINECREAVDFVVITRLMRVRSWLIRRCLGIPVRPTSCACKGVE